MDGSSRTLTPFNQPQSTAHISPGYSSQPQNTLGLAAAAAAAAVNSQTAQMQLQSQPPTANTSEQQNLTDLSQTSAAAATMGQPAADTYPHQVTGSGGPTATAPFLRDFSLVAEAAKRAQMSVMVRDLESVTL
ncbi:hypothetical protein AtubIFM56815_008137 [Aspergillus tubingensis]|uniref:Uncharacterized protein n=2 Tax=Aspergillus subgen. Circumdati TaxID=2720871 RepID=A0A8H3T442_ASPTU|nr:BTB/POZ domain family protein [Aspergillus tubingensis]GAQ43743.1 similar to An09g04510 [Aspergillus niger]GFN21240.1 BTB/POZ domain family protein [Aspergillus tubingensis]GLA64988.1 hypothetical protein AtubIFM54640_006723 [Aspergillus tubingensis]GLA83928.1 hypothetical protein AtubIFM56815_008137 [Aspergillus tubingensis]GLA96022.1 hypothetical protein AtubIFM57143_003486 [Aspergillus tubingensis]